MSLLLDALKRAEEAKRAKIEPVDGNPQSPTASSPPAAANVTPAAANVTPAAANAFEATSTASTTSATPKLGEELFLNEIAYDDNFASEVVPPVEPAPPPQDSEKRREDAAGEARNAAPEVLPDVLRNVSRNLSRNSTSVKPLSLDSPDSLDADAPEASLRQPPIANKQSALSVAEIELASLLQQSITDGDASGTNSAVLPTLSPATAAFRAARSQSSAAALLLDPAQAVSQRAAAATTSREGIARSGAVSSSSSLNALSIAGDQSTDQDRNYAQDIVDSATSSRQQAQRDQVNNAFNVKKTSQQSASLKWLMPIVVLLVLIVVGASWYVWQEVNLYSRPGISPSPMTSGAANSTAAPNNIGASSDAMSPTFSPSTGVVNSSATVSGTNNNSPNAISAEAQALIDVADAKSKIDELPPLLPPPAIAVVALVGTTPRPVKSAKRAAEIPLTLRESFAKQIDALPLSPPKNQSIVRLRSSSAAANSATSVGLNPALTQAYAALSRGSYAEAMQSYAQAIAAQPANIDANLGFATAAARAGELEMAGRFYRRVLELDPRNATAAAALLTLASASMSTSTSASTSPENNNNRAATSSLAEATELQRLIDQDPASAASHFALGNLFASERRWLEAQQAFFAATRLAPQNPDYLYNLAVSLDNLGQTKPAADFYRRALAALSAKGHAQFQVDVVEKRLAAIALSASASAVVIGGSATNTAAAVRQPSP